MSSAATTLNLPSGRPATRLTQARVALSEWTKLRSLRSTLYTLLATAVVTIGFGVAASAITASRWSSTSLADKASFNPRELDALTEREREVLRMLAAGLSNAEIAAALVVSGPPSSRLSRTSWANSDCATAFRP